MGMKRQGVVFWYIIIIYINKICKFISYTQLINKIESIKDVVYCLKPDFVSTDKPMLGSFILTRWRGTNKCVKS